MERREKVAVGKLLKGRCQTFKLRLPCRMNRSFVKNDGLLESIPGKENSMHKGSEADRCLEFPGIERRQCDHNSE